MTISPDTIDAMIAAGATAEVIAAAWKAEIAAQGLVQDERREKDRDRQRRHRESRGVTVTSGDIAGVTQKVSPSSPLVPPSLSPEPQTLPPIIPPPTTSKGRDLAFPEWLPKADWTDFAEFRRRKGGFTVPAARLCLGKLTALRDEGYDPSRVLQQSIERGWTGLFPLKEGEGKAVPQKPADLSGIEPWATSLVSRYGDSLVRKWMDYCRVEGDVLHVRHAITADTLRRNHMSDLRLHGILEVRTGITPTATEKSC